LLSCRLILNSAVGCRRFASRVAVRFDLSGALCKIKENSELDRKVHFGRTKPTLLLQKKSERWLIWPPSVAPVPYQGKAHFGRTKPTILLRKKSERWLIWPPSVAPVPYQGKAHFGRTKPTILLRKKSERWLIWPPSVAHVSCQRSNPSAGLHTIQQRGLLALRLSPFFYQITPASAGYERDALMTRITAFADAIPKMERNSQSGIIMPLRTMVMWGVYGAVVWARSARASSKARIANFRRESALRS
jgi:hypothetical protein